MTRSCQPPRSNKPSIKYKCSPLEGASFELTNFDGKDYTPTSSGSSKQNGKKSEPKSSQILSTSELISAVGRIWDCANRPLAFLRPKTNLSHNDGDFPKDTVLRCSHGKGNDRSSTSAESQHFTNNPMTTGDYLSMVHPNIECLKVSEKISFFEPLSGKSTRSLRGSNSVAGIPNEYWKENSPGTVGILYDLRNIYEWMNEISLPGRKHQENSTLINNKKIDECCLFGDKPTNLGNTANPATNLTIERTERRVEITKCKDSLLGQSSIAVENASTTSLCSDYYLKAVQTTEENVDILRTPISRLHADYSIEYLDSHNLTFEECQHKNEDGHLYEDKKDQQSKFVMESKSKIEVCSPNNNKPHFGIAKQEHAFAGALAGIFVSICLHPVDTVKTVIQSCRADQRSINYIVRSIITERGVTGLYRGIASNIASSAPISAVYTFTYETVKGALLPFLPMGYQSFAHCIGGGGASIATSFIFTPSECIKQQMQVGSHYQNCWNALVGIIKKGGLPSLYAGWGAVLCRNIPHSIIKFYTYESMKQLMLQSLGPNAQPSTLQTLICGGLAGSTAALFTTPFDVVKTRLQTQIPGSIHQYDGVFNTLVEIGQREGLKGLYRGLIPRLIMYVSQGAIFFASYESFKKLFSVEVAPQAYAQTIEHLRKKEDEAPLLTLEGEETGSLMPEMPKQHRRVDGGCDGKERVL
ncbi:uncharacterized protein LOC130792478 isoform X1 [Actinidia eriantha]|uniref:uncharacterized protein LOC130792478 isoform X1 n=1 Tax=Actinidia eriantha TaxID=165200 RepID=UPI002588ED0C|nr:uncharacterized protein LOC130792478 isoform X1 [Actinidia eriantha]XP_057509963.1 uncharacterized protein LOC130792478 isoform X1 [Actinidia eriantha]XP_057509964.1 uncharacterized protein LOC130792478 isoform X1 [Actinidia eriantha]